MKNIKKAFKIMGVTATLAFGVAFSFPQSSSAHVMDDQYWANDSETVGYGRMTSGNWVRALQLQLHSAGFTSVGSIDGKFGSKTYGALKSYQSKYGLTADGIAGPQTWGHMDNYLKTSIEHDFVVNYGQGYQYHYEKTSSGMRAWYGGSVNFLVDHTLTVR